ncbi:hypothetical protein LguiB_033685 [Lonicera macranthoides]
MAGKVKRALIDKILTLPRPNSIYVFYIIHVYIYASSLPNIFATDLDNLVNIFEAYTTEKRDEFVKKCLPLYKSALTGDWKTAQNVINEDANVVHASITEGGETALHIAAAGKNIHFVEKLISKMDNHLETTNRKGNTALCFAAAEGNLRIVELMIQANNTLPTICGPNGAKPIYMAASLGHRDIVNCLYPSDFNTWPREERAQILTACIASGLFDVALKMIREDNKILPIQDGNNETALDVLSVFAAKELLKCILKFLSYANEMEVSNLISKCPELVLEAARLGNTEFLVMLLQHFPDLIWTADSLNRSIFHHAILYRHRDIFNLIYEVDSIRSFLTSKRDQDDNNMLHLAAKLAPQNELDMVSGAALQMQRELLWFMEVRKIVQPSYRNMKNTEGETPADVFTKEHASLMLKGQKWMTDTATASMVVATIIASVVFTSIFTVPGGINEKGVPNMSSHKPFMKFFYLSEAIALFSSLTSILMFLSILTSRYAERDFLHSLPLKLMIGVTTLIVSLGTMALAFCSATFLSYHQGFPWIHFLLGVFSIVPLLCFLLKFHLLRDVICSTYDARIMFRHQNRLFN